MPYIDGLELMYGNTMTWDCHVGRLLELSTPSGPISRILWSSLWGGPLSPSSQTPKGGPCRRLRLSKLLENV